MTDNRFGAALFTMIALMALSLPGCDRDPSGRGAYAGSARMAEGSPGAVLLLFTGEGIREVVGEGGTRGWMHLPSEEAGGLRVVLVDPDSSGALTFRVEVEDLSGPPPEVSVVQAVDRANQRVAASEVQVRLNRR